METGQFIAAGLIATSFCKQISMRQIIWVWAVSDEGAADFDILDSHEHFKHIRQMFGPGHALARILRVVCDVIWNLGLEPLAIIYGYVSPKN